MKIGRTTDPHNYAPTSEQCKAITYNKTRIKLHSAKYALSLLLRDLLRYTLANL